MGFVLAGQLLIFDSGIGGISVLREIKLQLPHIPIDYLFDNAYYPYGQLSENQLIKRLCYLIGGVVARDKPSLVVIACNSASTAALPALRELLDIPVVGVVPAIKPAAAMSRSKKIGLLATQGTVNRDYIDQLIAQHAADCEIVRVGSNELVAMAEEAFCGNAVPLQQLRDICAPFIQQVDTLVLGCTHFPLLSSEIKQVTQQQVCLVDSGSAIASRVAQIITNELPLKIKTPGQQGGRALYTKANLNASLITALQQEGFTQLSLVECV